MTEAKQKQIFEQWLDDYQAMVFKVLRAYAEHSADREDLFQEIAIQIWRSIPNYQGHSAAGTWVYRVALNTALTWKRKEKKHQKTHSSIGDISHVLKEHSQIKDERLTWLYEEIMRLNPIDKSLALLLLDGFSYKEMAHMLGISETNVGVKVHRIKKHLTTQAKKLTHHGI